MSAEYPAISVLVKAVALEQAMGVLGLGSWVLQKGGRGAEVGCGGVCRHGEFLLGVLAQLSHHCPDRMKMTAHLQCGSTGAATM